ncbi:O-antigen ligase family protein [Bacteroides sp. 224]|uniref:O-antigen ligase family protein n=1 Tax=Bacteroides sp. 224 TaxID=2302936 RepID=UPI0013D46259|nr:O-antigen ligase family protein [Bacteroides sp. 224]NDV66550.1 O-antigen ligase domain-containing protein [Bacteroides sp. 224]
MQKIINNVLLATGVLFMLSVIFYINTEVPIEEFTGYFKWIAYSSCAFVVCSFFITLISFNNKNNFSAILVWIIIFLGVVESIWGLHQLYGYVISNHSLYYLTGSFFNPGPYSGYLALILPLCLNEYLKVSSLTDKHWKDKVCSYLSGGILLLIICILPAGMSRSAWIAAIISCTFVYGIHHNWLNKLNNYRKHQTKKFITLLSIFIIITFLGILLLFSFKKNSANGRLFMWKITTQAILKEPLTGYGTGSFPRVYGATQEQYFANGNYSEQEELVAGSPEYAFNEYLHIALEWGIPVLIILLTFVAFCFYKGLQKKRIGICGAILSLLVFAFSSYPFQLPAFVVTFVFLLAACLIDKNDYVLLLFALLIGGVGVYLLKTNVYEECKKWTKTKMLYNMHAYQAAKKEYQELYPALNNRAAFLFEYGHCLHKLNEYEESTIILLEAANYSCDPMIFNIIGKNYQAQQQYKEAEHWFKRSTHLLPGRIYPYYLLTKLYAEPAFNEQDKMKEMAKIVLTKEPKVQSTAIKEMRREVEKLLKE